jgi:hypothetical protein
VTRRPARAAASLAAATLLAGAVGVVRQRTEASRVRQGRLRPASADAELPPERDPGRIGGRLAAWVPAAPTTASGRVTAAVWASPLTAVGLLLAALAGRRPRWDPRYGCLVVDGMRGPSAAALRLVGADANTVGHVVLSRHRRSPEALLAHEAVHVRQGERLGPLLLPAYVWLSACYGYRDHPLERAARAGARNATQR